MNLANELAALQSELESLRSENKILRENKIVLDFEIDQLKRRLSHAEQSRDAHLAGKVRLKTLLDETGASLVAGINRYNAEAHAENYEALAHQPQAVLTNGGVQ
jgi:regulator of replication initiation timing